MAIYITFIRSEYEPYELSYYQELDKNEKLQREIFGLEEERDIALEQVESWKALFEKKLPSEKLEDKFSIVCAISKLQYLLDELEDMV